MKTLRRFLCLALALVGVSAAVSAQTALISVDWNIEPGPSGTTTLYDDGSIKTSVDWLPDPPDSSIPGGLIPPGASTGNTADVGEVGSEAEAKAAVAVAIGGYLLEEWWEYGIEQLRAFLDELLGGENRMPAAAQTPAPAPQPRGVSNQFNHHIANQIIAYLDANAP